MHFIAGNKSQTRPAIPEWPKAQLIFGNEKHRQKQNNNLIIYGNQNKIGFC